MKLNGYLDKSVFIYATIEAGVGALLGVFAFNHHWLG